MLLSTFFVSSFYPDKQNFDWHNAKLFAFEFETKLCCELLINNWLCVCFRYFKCGFSENPHRIFC